MTIVSSLLALTVLTSAGNTTLLDFTAPWCAPCRSMEPLIARLEAEGQPIRRVHFDQQRDLAQRFGVRTIPCFVMLVDGREVDRVQGTTTYARLRQMLAMSQNVPTSTVSATSVSSTGPPNVGGYNIAVPTSSLAGKPHSETTELVRRFLTATVRIRVSDRNGTSYGSGTIIDRHGDESLILTCGHIFRDSAGKGHITVDLFVDGESRSFPAQLVRYDLNLDLGLISCRPGLSIEPVQVAPRSRQVAPEETVWVTGCDHGQSPKWQQTKIASLNKFIGPPNVQVHGEPPDGRSGGGLFTNDGLLIGVCNAADPADQQGLYAGLAAVHGELDQAGLSFVYHTLPSRRPQQSDSLPEARGLLASTAVPPSVVADLGETEIICIVRSKHQPQKSELYVLDHAPADLVSQILAARSQTVGNGMTPSHLPSTATASTPVTTDIIRGQSPRR